MSLCSNCAIGTGIQIGTNCMETYRVMFIDPYTEAICLAIALGWEYEEMWLRAGFNPEVDYTALVERWKAEARANRNSRK